MQITLDFSEYAIKDVVVSAAGNNPSDPSVELYISRSSADKTGQAVSVTIKLSKELSEAIEGLLAAMRQHRVEPETASTLDAG